MANSKDVGQRTNKRFFIEAVVILGIITILSFIIIPNFRAMDKMAKEETVKSIARLTDRAIKDWSSFNGGAVPLYLWGYDPYLDEFLGVERKNPFSGRLTEPRQTFAMPPYAPEPGAVYYYKDSQPGAYVIIGYGQDISKPLITINRVRDPSRS